MRITLELIRKKAEHHLATASPLHDLEELSLHQLNIEQLDPILGQFKKLKIIYLQNNLISRIGWCQHRHELCQYSY